MKINAGVGALPQPEISDDLQWVPLKKFFHHNIENYGEVLIGSNGMVKINSKLTQQYLTMNGNGGVYLSSEDSILVLLVHRLVCYCFHGPPTNATFVVNHLDRNKENNNYMNLEWCTQYENIVHALGKKLLLSYSSGENIICPCIREAAEVLGYSYSQLHCRLKRVELPTCIPSLKGDTIEDVTIFNYEED